MAIKMDLCLTSCSIYIHSNRISLLTPYDYMEEGQETWTWVRICKDWYVTTEKQLLLFVVVPTF